MTRIDIKYNCFWDLNPKIPLICGKEVEIPIFWFCLKPFKQIKTELNK